MRAETLVRFLATAGLSWIGLIVGAIAGVHTYEAVGNPEGFEALSGALVGGPIGLFGGAILGNWIGGLFRPTEARAAGGWAPVFIEATCFSIGVLLPSVLLMAGDGYGTGGLMFVLAGGVGGFAMGAFLAEGGLRPPEGSGS